MHGEITKIKNCITVYKWVSKKRMGENHKLNFSQNIVGAVKIKIKHGDLEQSRGS
jgi:hypothetical protein